MWFPEAYSHLLCIVLDMLQMGTGASSLSIKNYTTKNNKVHKVTYSQWS